MGVRVVAAALAALALGCVINAPRALAIDAETLARVEDLDGLSVSPDGAHIVFQRRRAQPRRDAFDLSWWMIGSDGQGLRRIADGGEPIILRSGARLNGLVIAPAPVWSPDGRSVLIIRRENGRDALWRIDLRGRERQVSQGPGDVLRAGFSDDGGSVFYATGPDAHQIAAGLREEGREGFLYGERFTPFYAQQPLLPSALRNAAGGPRETIWRVGAEGGVARIATEAEAATFAARTPLPVGRSAYRQTLLAESGAAQLWTEARHLQGYGAPLTLVAAAPPGGDPFICSDAACQGTTFLGAWRRPSGEILFARSENFGAATGLYVWRPGEAAVRTILVSNAKLVGNPFEWSCALARDHLVCFYEDARTPRKLVAIDLDTGAIATLFDANPSLQAALAAFEVQPFDLALASGARSWGVFVAAPGSRAMPAVIVTYRCSGFLRGGVGDEYPVFAMASQGLAVLCIEAPANPDESARMTSDAFSRWLRGPGEPGKRDMQAAIEAGIARFVAAGRIDRSRVAVTGLSFGAESVTYALARRTMLRAAIASSAGIEPSAYALYGPGQEAMLQSWGLDPTSGEGARRWRELSLAQNASVVRTPILFNVSDRELLLTLEPYVALRTARRPVEMYVYPDAYHFKWRPAQRLAIYQRNIDWLNFWLRDVEPGDPGIAARWREMRALLPDH